MTNIQIGNASNSVIIGGSVNNSTLTNASESLPYNETFAGLRRALEHIGDVRERETLVQAASELEKSAGRSSYMEKYKSFMQQAANHMTLVAPFLPELSKLLG